MPNSESRKAALPARLRSNWRASDASIAATKLSRLLLLVVALAAFGLGLRASAQGSAKYTTHTLALPSHGKGNITMDYIAYDPKTNDVWVPAINMGSVFVIDASNEKVHEIAGFATKEIQMRNGRMGAQGPSGVYVGDGVVYIGDRAD